MGILYEPLNWSAVWDEVKNLTGTVAMRGARPAIRWVGVLVVLLIGLALATAMFRSALTGLPMPDMTAGLGPIIIGLAPLILEQITRSLEKRQEANLLFHNQARAPALLNR